MGKIDWNYGIIAVLAGTLFLPFLGQVHLFDWDEINFAECAREMLATGDYLRPQINFSPFWEKPPLFIWFQALSMHIFGINEYAARFPNAVCGILTLLVLYNLGKNLYDKTFGWFWVLSYLGSILPHLYFKSGIIDPWFNLFIFLSLVFLVKSEKEHSEDLLSDSFLTHRTALIIGGIFSGLAVLTKGPVGFLIVALTWFFKLLVFKELSFAKFKRFFVFGCVALLTALTWFGVEILKNGTWFVNEFITYTIRLAKTEDAGHGGFFGYHFVVLFFGCFPASIFALRAILRGYNFFGENVDFSRWMKTLFWVVLILFSLVQSKIVHYSSMCYLPLTFLSALTLKSYFEKDTKVTPWVKWTIGIVGILLGLIVAAVPFIGQNIDILKPLASKDLFAQKNMDAEVFWSGREAIIGLFLVATSLAFPIVLKMRGLLRGVSHLFLSTAVFVQLVLFFYVGNIEGYSQRAALDFYESKQSEDCYVRTYGFKSYAHLFYSRLRQPLNPKYFKENDWLLRGGDVDKPTYVVAKIGDKTELSTIETLEFLYEKNGFIFFRRKR
ncbi:MAG: glycosyltransferase family 39 protein [Saprospiraceae bacterium]|nr:glycosyltransferase family 39 protein [Saprospiraceae bacterium]